MITGSMNVNTRAPKMESQRKNHVTGVLIHAICFKFHCEPGSASVELKQSDDHWRYECEYTSAQDGEPTEKSRHRRANVRYTVDFDINLSAVRRSQLLSSIEFVNFSPTAFSDVLSIGY